MQITKDAVVELDYVLTDDEGEILDESDGEPLTYIHGHGQLVPGLEAALLGQGKGANLKVVVAPKDGYGEKHADNVVSVPLDQFPEDDPPEVGMAIEVENDQGQSMMLWIVGVDEEGVDLSPDHPLAGVNLHFDVTIRGVRPATREELAHGHVHGPGGHHHH